MTPHISAELGDFAKTVIMPGDPKRAELIANNYLKDVKLINSVRGILAFTGLYNGNPVSVMASGMGMPSMGIYSYELFKFYGVEQIIRIGSCGSFTPDLHLLDLILVDETFTEGNYALTFNNELIHLAEANEELNNLIEDTANENEIKITKGTTLCSEVFDSYMQDSKKVYDRFPKDLNIIGSEMEAFALLYNAKVLNKKAACILTVADDHFHDESVTAEAREKSLDTMINLALKTSAKL